MSANPAESRPDSSERSLDPEDWDAFRRLAHRAVDDMVDYLQTVRDRPAWKALPEEAKNVFGEAVPREPMPESDVYEQVQQHILPYPTNNIHPRFWSWVGGTGTATQLIADLVISAMNSGGLGFDEVASSHVELQLLNWMKTLFGFPPDSSGLLVSGGSMANLVGLAVARTHQSSDDVRANGIDLRSNARLVYYASSETHSSVKKAIELLGLGAESLHTIPVDAEFRIDIDALETAIAADRAAGLLPACIVGNAGTVNTGATDDLTSLANIAQKHDLWFHVDGAFGACVRLSADSAHIVNGMERADSLAFDLHKWLYVQYDCGCVLVRGNRPHRETFSVIPPYLRKFDRGLASGPLNFSEYGVQLSRSFKALRAWMALKTEGTDRYGEQIEQNVRQAQYLSELVDSNPSLERLAPTAMNIVNYRFIDPRCPNAELDDLNAEILMQLHERGIAAPSSTQINDQFSIRVAICNHRSRRSDFEALVDASVNIGRQLVENLAG